MPLHEPPLQKCGSGHWLTDECPKGECELLVFERDIPVYRKVSPDKVERRPFEPAKNLVVEEVPEVTADGPLKKAMTPAEKQKLWRQKNAEKVRERDRERKAAKRSE